MNIKSLADKIIRTPIIVLWFYFLAIAFSFIAVFLFIAKAPNDEAWTIAAISYLLGSKESLENRIERLEAKK